jgi:MFS family permease
VEIRIREKLRFKFEARGQEEGGPTMLLDVRIRKLGEQSVKHSRWRRLGETMRFATFNLIMPGIAPGQQELFLLRVLHALGGGGVTMVAQSIIVNSCAREKRGQVAALLGLCVLIGPTVAPVLGGWLSDNFSRCWCDELDGLVIGLATALIAAGERISAATDARFPLLQRPSNVFEVVRLALLADLLGALEPALNPCVARAWLASVLAMTVVTVFVLVLGTKATSGLATLVASVPLAKRSFPVLLAKAADQSRLFSLKPRDHFPIRAVRAAEAASP